MTLVLRWAVPRRRLNLQWAGGRPASSILEQQRGTPALAVVIGPPGGAGPAGEIAPAASLVTDLATTAGMPLAIDRTTRRLVRADAANYPRAFVVGLAAEDTAAGFVVDAIGAGNLTLTDWTAVTGVPQLAAGLIYFLATGGGLTTIAPTSGAIAVVGEAISPTTINLRRSAPILL